MAEGTCRARSRSRLECIVISLLLCLIIDVRAWSPTSPTCLQKFPMKALYPTKLFSSPQKSPYDQANDDSNINALSGYVTGPQGYSRTLMPTFLDKDRKKKEWLRKERQREREEDGYADLLRQKRTLWRKLTRPLRLVKRNIVFPQTPGTLILVRHGESNWNANKTFTGWADPNLSERGHREIEHAARLLLEGGYNIDVVFTSRLSRAIRSAWILLSELNEVFLPVFKSWRLNERHYGALTGLSKPETAEKLGVELVQSWRGSLRSRPPAINPSHQYWPGKDRKYFDLAAHQIPASESLLDCMERTRPLWEDKISYELQMGRNVLVVAHANTLRGLVKIIDDIGDDEIQEISIPTGIPVVYKFGRNMKPVPPEGNRQTAFQVHMSGMFLEKPGLLKEGLKLEEEWSANVPGYNFVMDRDKKSMTTLERSLNKLEAERALGAWAGQFVDTTGDIEDDGGDGNMGKGIQLVEDEVWDQGIRDVKKGQVFDPDETEFHQSANKFDDNAQIVSPTIITNNPCVTSLPGNDLEVASIGDVPIRKDAVIVIIRHGKTEHNKLGLFTGWEDAPLAREGVEEAKAAGKLLKEHGFEFDVVYTSWLSRAIETALHVMDELDELWLPIIKSWRLNERMYGSLTGQSKQMVAQKYGQEQFKAWRRGYKVKPPPVSSFSVNYPGNDKRYNKYLKDVRVSFRESLIRTIEAGKPTKSRKFPKSESLHDCMERTIPYFTQKIVPEAINDGKRVLISSSENAIRGLLMHLCEIPEESVTDLEIPNGLPLIFDVKSKCIKLLDDGSGKDPLETYNFGSAANYLFRPCQNEDGSPDEECDIRWMSAYEDDSPPKETFLRPLTPVEVA